MDKEKAWIICMSESGAETVFDLMELFTERGEIARGWVNGLLSGRRERNGQTLREWKRGPSGWARTGAEQAYVLIFVGDISFAVRSIAASIRSLEDPAVLSIDDREEFVIPLLPGAMGIGYDLAPVLAAGLGAECAMASGCAVWKYFPLQLFASRNRLRVSEMERVKEIYSAMARGHVITIRSEFPWEGIVPEGILMEKTGSVPREKTAGEDPQVGIGITIHQGDLLPGGWLPLYPPVLSLGVECRRGKDPDELEEFLLKVLRDHDLSLLAVERICSIRDRQDEQAILAFAGKYHLKAAFYTPEQLMEVPGEFEESLFERSLVGADQICERSAAAGSGNGTVIVRKSSGRGMAAAVAIRDWSAVFPG